MKASILIVSMALLIAIVAVEAQISLEENTDRPGMNYKTDYMNTTDPKFCANMCANDPNCKAWTYVKLGVRGTNSTECWLKNAIPDPVSDDCCISGVKSEAPPGAGSWGQSP